MQTQTSAMSIISLIQLVHNLERNKYFWKREFLSSVTPRFLAFQVGEMAELSIEKTRSWQGCSLARWTTTRFLINSALDDGVYPGRNAWQTCSDSWGIWLSEGGIERTNSISSATEWWEKLWELAMSDYFTKWFGVKGVMSADPFGTTMVEL